MGAAIAHGGQQADEAVKFEAVSFSFRWNIKYFK